jgi:hypothetical protein
VSVSETERADLYNGLSEVLTPSQTETLMGVVRLHDDVATRDDIRRLEAEMRGLKSLFGVMKDSVDRRIDRVFFAVMAMPVAIIAAVATIFG